MRCIRVQRNRGKNLCDCEIILIGNIYLIKVLPIFTLLSGCLGGLERVLPIIMPVAILVIIIQLNVLLYAG